MRSVLLLLFCVLCASAFAQGKKHRVVIEVNLPGTDAYNLVLNNIKNLKKAFAPEPVEVEVVCHGAGIDMLLRSNTTAVKVGKAAGEGVIFSACANTLRGRKIERSRLVGGVQIVPSGVAQVVRKQEAGWSYLKGAF